MLIIIPATTNNSNIYMIGELKCYIGKYLFNTEDGKI